MVKAAETVGSTLGSVMARVDTWMAQREEIARDLRAAADQLMSGESPLPWLRSKSAAAAKGKRTAGTGRKRTMSAAARKRISDAQKARWAKQKSAAGKAKAAKKSSNS
jgi:hypothetical protein